MKIDSRRKILIAAMLVTASCLLNVGITSAIVDYQLFTTQQHVQPGIGVIDLIQLNVVGNPLFTWTTLGANVTLTLSNPAPAGSPTATGDLTLQAQNSTAQTPITVGSTLISLNPGASATYTVIGKFSSASVLALQLT